MEKNKKFIRVSFNNIWKYIQAADTLKEFTENFIKEFKVNNQKNNYFLFSRDKTLRTTKIENDETYQKYKNYFLKYPNLIEPYFTEEEKPIFTKYKCSECKINPIEGIMYICLNCENYTLCQKCENSCGEIHGHPLLMLRKEKYLEDFKKLIEDKDGII